MALGTRKLWFAMKHLHTLWQNILPLSSQQTVTNTTSPYMTAFVEITVHICKSLCMGGERNNEKLAVFVLTNLSSIC